MKTIIAEVKKKKDTSQRDVLYKFYMKKITDQDIIDTR